MCCHSDTEVILPLMAPDAADPCILSFFLYFIFGVNLACNLFITTSSFPCFQRQPMHSTPTEVLKLFLSALEVIMCVYARE